MNFKVVFLFISFFILQIPAQTAQIVSTTTKVIGTIALQEGVKYLIKEIFNKGRKDTIVVIIKNEQTTTQM